MPSQNSPTSQINMPDMGNMMPEGGDMKPQLEKPVTPGTESGDSHPHNEQEGQTVDGESTRDAQGGINRMGQDGNPITPRLGQDERPKITSMGGVKKKAKSAATKWAVAALGGTTALGGGVTFWSMFS